MDSGGERTSRGRGTMPGGKRKGWPARDLAAFTCATPAIEHGDLAKRVGGAGKGW